MHSGLRTFIVTALRQVLRFIFVAPKVLAACIRRLGGKSTGIEQTAEGALRHPTGTYAIFVIWQHGPIPWSVRNALEALKQAGINTILTSNAALSPEARAFLLANCHTLIRRDNSGYDFGAYRDATLFCLDTFEIGRLLYLNDSVYFFQPGLKELFDRLAHAEADACAAFENREHSPHLQSFCFSVSGGLARQPEFRNFWRAYLPVNSRLWAIHRGEIHLSRVIRSLTRNIEVRFTPDDLRPHLAGMSPEDLRRQEKFLPRQHRAPTGSGQPDVDDLLTRIASRSQIHTGGFLCQKYLRNPLMKRDLVYRLEFTPDEVEQCLNEIGETGHLDEIRAEMRQRGTGRQLPFLKRLAFKAGDL